MSPAHIGLAVLTMALWGFNFVAMKVSVEQIPPVFTAGLRFVVVALLLIWFVRMPRGRMKAVLAIAFTMGVLQFPLAFYALRFIDAKTAALLIQLEVPFLVILGVFVLKERIDWRSIVGIAVAFAGVAIMTSEPKVFANLFAVALMIVAGIVWAVANIQIKLLEEVEPLTLIAWIAAFSVPPLFLISFVLEDGQIDALVTADWRAYGSILYLAVASSIVAYGLWYRLLRRHPVQRVVPFMLLIPVFAVISSILLLGESLSWIEASGGALTIGGVAVIVFTRARSMPAGQ
ncbi:MAG: EamA family transporter [Alphaproteobacteria bacterium]|nr:EamA family transporter [Pseudomonadota bacterium]